MESLCQGKQIDFTSLDYKITHKKLGRSEIQDKIQLSEMNRGYKVFRYI